MNALLIYPASPETFWSYKYALKFISKKATHPPLGLISVAAMLPESWNKKLVDMNVGSLSDSDIEAADCVFISAMVIQKPSAMEVVDKCRKAGVRVVAGGPLFATAFEEFDQADHIVLNEAEITLPLFLEDLKNGNPKHLYSTTDFADLKTTPLPQWELLNMKKYSSMSIQYSRGCPYNCDFCEITSLFGHKFRTKSAEQLIAEMDKLYALGWRGDVFFSDDNFIGNTKKLKIDILPAMIEWMQAKKYPFSFDTQASINLSDDGELMHLMVNAGFKTVFIGIETTNEKTLEECSKFQNRHRDLVACVKNIQHNGLQVTGGFIVGFDNDGCSVFDEQTRFIQNSGIVTAMVGLLNAPKGTKLYQRLKLENRILNDSSGNNTDFSLNFIPKISSGKLIDGYNSIIKEIYSAKPFYDRVKSCLKEYKPVHLKKGISNLDGLLAFLKYIKPFIKSVWILGIRDKYRKYYWKLLFWSLIKKPGLFPLAITFAVKGFHFRNVFKELL